MSKTRNATTQIRLSGCNGKKPTKNVSHLRINRISRPEGGCPQDHETGRSRPGKSSPVNANLDMFKTFRNRAPKWVIHRPMKTVGLDATTKSVKASHVRN